MPRLQDSIGLDGAIITVRIELGAVEEALCRAGGLPVPPPFPTTALIDSGASRTTLHPMIIHHLGATQTGAAIVSVPGQEYAHLPLYRARITLGLHGPAVAAQVTRIVPATHTVAVLIGPMFSGKARCYSTGKTRYSASGADPGMRSSGTPWRDLSRGLIH